MSSFKLDKAGKPVNFNAERQPRKDAGLNSRIEPVGFAPETEHVPFDLASSIIAFEQGELDHVDVVALFQHLVDTGLAWSLQGCIDRGSKF